MSILRSPNGRKPTSAPRRLWSALAEGAARPEKPQNPLGKRSSEPIASNRFTPTRGSVKGYAAVRSGGHKRTYCARLGGQGVGARGATSDGDELLMAEGRFVAF
ncbi:hypothetical protein Kisp01_34160 [Kineosporia sp. NBRC 101677]|nr:hypothetical protein Kisp01_34160 [Kineosporia sp. NBRC 101677]